MNRDHRYVLYFQNHVPDLEFLQHPAFECKVLRGPALLRTRRIVAEQLCMPLDLRRDRLDLFFATWYSAPLVCPVPKSVVAAWDISYSTHGDQFALKNRVALSFFSRHSCRAAQGVITCSEFDKEQIEKYYQIPGERICALRLGVDERFSPAGERYDPERLRRKYNLPQRYLLSLGVIYTRRCMPTIIEAFTKASAVSDMGLVVVGRNATNPRIDISGLMRPLEQAGRGVYIPYLEEEDLVDMYRGASHYVSLSTVDGESMTLKEAMQCGIAVITNSMLEETIGGIGTIVGDPTDVNALAGGFRRAFSLPASTLANQLERGQAWVRACSSEKVAEVSLRFLETR